MNSAFPENFVLPRHFFEFGNKLNSHGAKSGECGNNLKRNSLILAAIMNMHFGTGVWSWRNNKFFWPDGAVFP